MPKNHHSMKFLGFIVPVVLLQKALNMIDVF